MKIISSADFKNNEQQFCTIDIRSQNNWDLGHVDGAIHLPLSSLAKKIDSVVKDKNKKVVVYCNRGRSSLRAAKKLDDLGYKNVFSLEGGFGEYKKI